MKCFVILGMHRSATSLIAKALHEAGVFMGKELLPADEANPQGYFEDISFLNLNKHIIATAGGSWKEPPSEQKILSLRENKSIMDMVENMVQVRFNQKKELWGFKDPRTALTIKLLHPFLPSPHYVAVFRSPIEIALSLKKRNQLSIQHGLELAKIYNERLFGFLNDTALSYNNYEML